MSSAYNTFALSLTRSYYALFSDSDKIRRTFHVSPDVIHRRACRNLDTDETVEFEFNDLIALMVELLTDEEFSNDKKNYLWAYSPAERHNPTRRYSELNSGTRFRDAAHFSGADRDEAKYRLCPILVWTDKCSPDFKRQAQLKPIAVACGKLIGSICRKVSGKRLAGFWPKGLQVVRHDGNQPASYGSLSVCVCGSVRTVWRLPVFVFLRSLSIYLSLFSRLSRC